MAYIGSSEIESFEALGDGSFVSIKFKDVEKPVRMSGTVFFKIQKEEKGEGTVQDNVIHYFAKEFLRELVDNDLEFYYVDGIATGIRVLAHNLREELLRETFDCTGGDAIPLSRFLDIVKTTPLE